MTELACDFCEFSGNNLQVRIYTLEDNKYKACSNCIPYCFNDCLEEYYKNIKYPPAKDNEGEYQTQTDNYMKAFIEYQQLVKELQLIKKDLFIACGKMASSKRYMDFLKNEMEKVIEVKEECGEM